MKFILHNVNERIVVSNEDGSECVELRLDDSFGIIPLWKSTKSEGV